MKYLAKSFTLPAGPLKSTACERCVWDRGEHAAWCPERTQEIPWTGHYEKLVISEKVPEGEIWFIAAPAAPGVNETADEWLRRCMVIRNVGNGCPQVVRLCADGGYNLLDCCETGIRSNGYAHDLDCEFHPSHKRFEIPR